MKRKKCESNPETEIQDKSRDNPAHYFNEKSEILELRKNLLDWYDENKRTLPWRTIAEDFENSDDNVRGYSVWVSEIMLQQTQVATVIEYYKKWIEKWPTMQDLAKASLDEINQAWAGLGYYSRGRRLWEGAKKIVEEHNGQLPHTAEELEKILPGVGKYTASAIASIAFRQPVGLVDGNVIRVISRMRKIGADMSNNHTISAFWSNANSIVSPTRPGDFNQAVMELGATICSPKGPECSKCPVKKHCSAKSAKDIEDYYCSPDRCKLCLPENTEEFNGVLVFPRKVKKTKVSEKTSVVCILKHQQDETVCLIQRPKTGLLANLFEMPSMEMNETENSKEIEKQLKDQFSVKVNSVPKYHGEIIHKFSHITQKYLIWSSEISDKDGIVQPSNYQKIEWHDQNDILNGDLAISTAMKKVFDFYTNDVKNGGKNPIKKRKVMTETKQQPSILKFFNKK